MPIEILMPALSPTMEEGTLSKWLKNEGDKVTSGDVIAEIETDKATMEVEAVDEGTIGKILIAAGTEGVKVNTAIAVLLQDGESAADVGRTRKPPLPAAEPAKAEAPAAGCSAGCRPQPKVEVASDPDIPAGTEMVSTTVREALRDAMAEEMRRRRRRLRHGRGSRRIPGRLQDHAGAARRNSAPAASSIRRSPSTALPASASVRR